MPNPFLAALGGALSGGYQAWGAERERRDKLQQQALENEMEKLSQQRMLKQLELQQQSQERLMQQLGLAEKERQFGRVESKLDALSPTAQVPPALRTQATEFDIPLNVVPAQPPPLAPKPLTLPGAVVGSGATLPGPTFSGLATPESVTRFPTRLEAESERETLQQKATMAARNQALDAMVTAGQLDPQRAAVLKQMGDAQVGVAIRPDTSLSLDEQAADALRRGDTAEFRRLEQVKRMGAAPIQPSYAWGFDPTTQKDVYATPEEMRAQSLQRPPATGGQNQARQALTDIRAMEAMIGSVGQAGQIAGWKGVGPMGLGSAKDLLRKWFGSGTNAEADLRTQIAQLKALTAHELFGSAFTRTEKQMLDRFTADINMTPAAIRDALRTGWTIAQTEREALGLPTLPFPLESTVTPEAAARAIGIGQVPPTLMRPTHTGR